MRVLSSHHLHIYLLFYSLCSRMGCSGREHANVGATGARGRGVSTSAPFAVPYVILPSPTHPNHPTTLLSFCITRTRTRTTRCRRRRRIAGGHRPGGARERRPAVAAMQRLDVAVARRRRKEGSRLPHPAQDACYGYRGATANFSSPSLEEAQYSHTKNGFFTKLGRLTR